MKSNVFWYFCLLVLAMGLVRTSFAQGCRVTMNPSYGTYQTYSTNGTQIYASVLVDGSAGCQPSLECNCSGAVHTPEAYNELGTVGGWGSGTPGCVNCYLSYQNNQSVTPTGNEQVPWSAEGEVNCSLAGLIYGVGEPTATLSLAVSNYKYASIAGGICTYNLSCPNGNQNATCGAQSTTMAAPCSYEYLSLGFIVYKSSTTKVCSTFGPAVGSNDAVNCQ